MGEDKHKTIVKYVFGALSVSDIAMDHTHHTPAVAAIKRLHRFLAAVRTLLYEACIIHVMNLHRKERTI